VIINVYNIRAVVISPPFIRRTRINRFGNHSIIHIPSVLSLGYTLSGHKIPFAPWVAWDLVTGVLGVNSMPPRTLTPLFAHLRSHTNTIEMRGDEYITLALTMAIIPMVYDNLFIPLA
jgi:hypothetical protein